jgi:hypothetical protein
MNLKDQIDIISFCKDPKLLNLPLLDTQEVILRAIYNLPVTPEQRKLYRDVFDTPYPKIKRPYDQTCLVLGRGSGKSTLSAAIAAYEACCTDWKKYLRPGEVANIFIFATREQQAIEVGRNMIFNMIEASPILRCLIESGKDQELRYLPKSRAGTMVLSTGAAITAMPCSAKVGRGYPIAIIILDEAAWYARESKNDATDQGIYDAMFPRMFQFKEDAKMIIISSPADKTGLVWERYEKREKHKDLYLCVRAPTWKMRTDLTKDQYRKFVDTQRILSPLGYNRELGAEFSSTKDPLLDRVSIERCTRKELVYTPLSRDTKYSYVMAFDAAFGDNDRFGIAIGHIEERKKDEFKVIIDLAEIVSAMPGDDFVSYAAARVVELYRKYDLFEVFCDQYQADSFGSILEGQGCNVTADAWTAATHRTKYGRLKNFVKRQLIEFPNNDDLIDELCGMQIRFLPTSGQYTVEHQIDGHDDIADAVAEVTFRLTEDLQMAQGVYTSDGQHIK